MILALDFVAIHFYPLGRLGLIDKDIITPCCIYAVVTSLFFGNAITSYSKNNTFELGRGGVTNNSKPL